MLLLYVQVSKPAAGRHPAGYIPCVLITVETPYGLYSSCLDYSVRLWVTISSPSPSPSPSSNPYRYYFKFTATRIYVLTSISALRAFQVYAITSISVTPEPFKSTP
ncbi:uncharacterized protein K441DRAFT_659352 [Cenococcum geophilum 1.58]|uniref:uncharacterized protein n=1 Tax=Cenococcum geophilum 1.58 TaxID=794803 RepID=UPI00358EB00F|nr:hypothetical protein K441DRAFT_659352 [Cenococcum geophilum 1.58]